MYVRSDGSGDAVLFLHGLPTSGRLWSGVIERMSGQFHCFAVDLPGLGRSPCEPRGLRDLAALAAGLEKIRREHKIQKWHIVAHDCGCVLAVLYAHQFPERLGRLALLTPSLFPELKPFYLFEALRKPVLGEFLASAINSLLWRVAMPRALDCKPELLAVASDFHRPFAGLRGSWRLMSLMRWGNPSEVLASIPALLPGIRVPTLIFHGLKDPAVPASFAERAAALLPDSQLIFLDSGHFLPMREARGISEALLRFFDQRYTAAPEPAMVAPGIPR